MQPTGQASTQAVSLVPTQGSAMMYVIGSPSLNSLSLSPSGVISGWPAHFAIPIMAQFELQRAAKATGSIRSHTGSPCSTALTKRTRGDGSEVVILHFGQAMVSRNTLSVFASTSCGTSWSRVSSFPVFISITCPSTWTCISPESA